MRYLRRVAQRKAPTELTKSLGMWAAYFGEKRRLTIIVQLVVLAVVTLIGGVMAARFVPGSGALEKGEALSRSHRLGPAERLFWDEIQRGPVTLPLLVAFLDNHHMQRILGQEGLLAPDGAAFVVPEVRVDELLARPDLDADVRTLARFWRASLEKSVPDALRTETIALAAREPPAPFANRLLGREAHRDGRISDAVARLEREGIFFPERRDDFASAMQLLAVTDEWDEIEKRIRDPRVAPLVPPSIRYPYAVKKRDVGLALRSIVASALLPRPLAPLALAIVSGFMWMLFALRLGRMRERVSFRLPLFAAAFVAGVLSVLPTLLIVGLEDTLLHFKERGDLVSDLIFFTVGVGLREELAKLLLFLPLLPILRRKGTRLDALTCGALVGLGFAAEENISYLQQGLSTALSRFLTANFLHMALTAILAVATYDAVRERDGDAGTAHFSRALLTVVAMHGAYDFFLSNAELEGLSFLSMTIFVLLTRRFMTEVRLSQVGAGPPLLPRFAQAIVVVTCASFVYASSLVGPGAAAGALAQGLLGLILIVIMFVQELARA